MLDNALQMFRYPRELIVKSNWNHLVVLSFQACILIYLVLNVTNYK